MQTTNNIGQDKLYTAHVHMPPLFGDILMYKPSPIVQT